MLSELKKELNSKTNKEKAKLLQGFFKTGKGQYGEGDIFLGITVPETRKTAQRFKDLSLKETEELLNSPIHEERLCAILILVHIYQTSPEKRKEIVDFYLKNTKRINNWDLVDLSADKILGEYLYENQKELPLLTKLANSENLWEKRISIISTFAFIKKKEPQYTLEISKILLNDKHDLIQKAVGWMLREVGKRVSQEIEEDFLKEYYKQMPRTMLRYAIEKLEEGKRKKYLNGSIESV